MKDEDFKKVLTAEQYRVMRQQGTEQPFTGKYLKHNKSGVYKCAACGSTLFQSSQKYESNDIGLAGWPSFSDVANSKAVILKEDKSLGMDRIEVVCKNCGSHLGHLFDDNDSPTKKHYCINSCALNFTMSQSKN